MNSYKLTIVEYSEREPVVFEFTDNDIHTFDVILQSKFSKESQYHSEVIDPSQIKAQVLIGFIGNSMNFNKITESLTYINFNFDAINEVLVYKNDTLICDLKNIVDFSSISTLMDNGNLSGLKLSIIEGV